MFSDVFVVDRPGVNVYIVFERMFLVFYGKPLQTMIFQRCLGKIEKEGGGGVPVNIKSIGFLIQDQSREIS